MTRAYSRVMKEAGYGRIINIASMYGMMGTNQQIDRLSCLQSWCY